MSQRARQRRAWSPRVVALVALVVLVAVAIVRVNNGSSTSFGATVASMRVRSASLGSSFVVGLASPAGGGADRALLVLLPQDPATPGTSLTRSMLAALAVLGTRAPDLVLPAGPAGVYSRAALARRWEGYLLRRAIPAARTRLHADPERITVGAIGAGAAPAAMLLARAPASFCQAPTDARLSLRQAQQTAGPVGLQRATAAESDTPVVYAFLDAYAHALATCAHRRPA